MSFGRFSVCMPLVVWYRFLTSCFTGQGRYYIAIVVDGVTSRERVFTYVRLTSETPGFTTEQHT